MLCVHKVVSQKIDLSFGLRKNKNFGAKNKTFYGTCFIFFTPITCNVFFRKTLRTHMNYGDVLVDFFLKKLTLRNLYFSIGTKAHGSRVEFPVIEVVLNNFMRAVAFRLVLSLISLIV
jgi:hypothetical protein